MSKVANPISLLMLLRSYNSLYFPLHGILWINRVSYWVLHGSSDDGFEGDVIIEAVDGLFEGETDTVIEGYVDGDLDGSYAIALIGWHEGSNDIDGVVEGTSKDIFDGRDSKRWFIEWR